MIKTATFAIMHFTVAFGVAYLLTGDLVIGGAVAMVEPMINTVAFYFHEKVWNRLQRRPAPIPPAKARHMAAYRNAFAQPPSQA